MEKSIDNLVKSSSKLVGMKQVLRSVIESDAIWCVVIAQNADKAIKDKILSEVKSKSIEVMYCKDMQTLGAICGIDVGAAVVGLLAKS